MSSIDQQKRWLLCGDEIDASLNLGRSSSIHGRRRKKLPRRPSLVFLTAQRKELNEKESLKNEECTESTRAYVPSKEAIPFDDNDRLDECIRNIQFG